MVQKGNKLYSILHSKCPHCHEGQFFVDGNPYHLMKAGDILDQCPVCARRYTPEPGFYYGGMYVSYALGVALFVSIYVAILVLYPAATMWTYVIGVVAGLVVFAPVIYMYSKIIWANLFFAYKGVARTEKELAQEAARRVG
jgi:hypothetical protein